MALLQGLMDSDGYGNKGVAEFTSSHIGIQNTFTDLVHSLGIRSKVVYRYPTCNGKIGKRSMSIFINRFTNI